MADDQFLYRHGEQRKNADDEAIVEREPLPERQNRGIRGAVADDQFLYRHEEQQKNADDGAIAKRQPLIERQNGVQGKKADDETIAKRQPLIEQQNSVQREKLDGEAIAEWKPLIERRNSIRNELRIGSRILIIGSKIMLFVIVVGILAGWFPCKPIFETLSDDANRKIERAAMTYFFCEMIVVIRLSKNKSETDEEMQKLKTEFETKVRVMSAKYEKSTLVIEAANWITDGFSKMINAADRSSYSGETDVSVSFEVYTDRIVCDLRTCTEKVYDFKIRHCANLTNPLQQVAIARAIASLVKQNVAMKYPKGAAVDMPCTYGIRKSTDAHENVEETDISCCFTDDVRYVNAKIVYTSL